MIAPERLGQIRDRESLFGFLRRDLGWPVDPEDPFTYQGPELSGEAAERVEVSRIVPFGAEDPFLIMLAEFRNGFRRAELREILRAIRREMRERGSYGRRSLEEIVFLCAEPGYAGVRFVRFTEQEGRPPRMASFGWRREDLDSTRTLCEINLPALALRPTLTGAPDWTEARPRWLAAWDVERVTRDFFKEYRAIFEEVERLVTGLDGDRRLFTQRLFNRLMFLHFLSKKGWLRFDGSTDYLRALWRGRDQHPEASFYRTHLLPLFFSGLNNVHVARLVQEGSPLQARVGEIPYLNGGLFVKCADEDQGEQVEDRAFERIIEGLLSRWNFTVSESTPLDVEVAVDPEMLGKVFEELVTGRHESGSYYTPRPIVAFMCREALKGYLTHESRELPEAVARFVDEHDAEGLTDPEGALDRLKRVKVCDPACGSGAYLLGMLHELVELRRCLFRSVKVDPVTDYRRKLEIIQQNLYGVDIDEFAVNIARLRLWLSLSVEHQGKEPEPLPNLDFKIECGDSLLAPHPHAVAQGGIDMFRDADLQEFARLKGDYSDPYWMGSKAELKERIDAVRQRLAEWLHGSGAVRGFDWWAEFAEVFLEAAGGKGGFDIIVANPPYVRQELIKELKPALKAVYPEIYSGTADLYCYFYGRAVQLLRKGGMLAFISSNKWFKAKYGEALRGYMGKECSIRSITDFGSLPVFQTATTYPTIVIAQRRGSQASRALLTQVDNLDAPYPDVLAIQRESGESIPSSAISGTIWTLAGADLTERLARMEAAGCPLERYPGARVYRGLITGLNDAFYLNDAGRQALIDKDPRSAELIRPLIIGEDVRKWRVRPSRRWIILTRIGVEIDRYPAILEHLRQWQPGLETRWDKGEHWWELRSCDYYDVFERPKIIYQEICTYQSFAYDVSGSIVNNKVFMIPTNDLYLLGVLNSRPVWEYLKNTCSGLVGGALAMQRPFVYRTPIPLASDSDRAAIAGLVEKCLEAGGVGCEGWEREIDGRVEGLYGL